MKRRVRHVLLIALAAGCGRIDYAAQDGGAAGRDGRGDGAGRPDAGGLSGGLCGFPEGGWTFGPATLVEELSTTLEENDPVLAPGGLLLYFARVAGADFDVFVAERPARDQPFGVATPVSEANTPMNDWHFGITADRLAVYLSTGRPGGPGQTDIWLGTRAAPGDPFADFAPVPNVNTSGPEHDAWPSPDGMRLYLQTGGPPDLLVARRLDAAGPFDPPQPIAELDTAAFGEDSLSLTEDEGHIFYASNRDGDRDLFHAWRPSLGDPFGPAERLDALSVVGEADREPYISLDGCELFFVRGASPAGDLYRAPIVGR